MRLNRTWMMRLSGGIWFLVGFMLLIKGLRYVVFAAQEPEPGFLIRTFGGSEQAALILVVLGLFIGFMKGKFVLAKTAKKGIDKVLSLPEPVRLSQVYTPRYYLLIGIMVGLGFVLRFVPTDIRGTVDIAIGSALMNGAFVYFRARVCTS